MKWLKNTWGNMWNWTVNSWNRMWEVLLKHTPCVYTALALIILFLGYILWSEVRHTTEVIGLQRDSVVLLHEIEVRDDLVGAQKMLIDAQQELVGKLRENIEASKKVIQLQEDIIKQLIDYLKAIDEWPPRGPINPDRIAI